MEGGKDYQAPPTSFVGNCLFSNQDPTTGMMPKPCSLSSKGMKGGREEGREGGRNKEGIAG